MSAYSKLSPQAQLADDASQPWFCDRDSWDMRLPDGFLKCVVFIGIKQRDERSNGVETFIPKATGFLVMAKDQDRTFVYVVTAEHVISGLSLRKHKIFVRINTKEGGTTDYEAPIETWRFHPQNEERVTDVAVSFFYGRKGEADFKAIPLSGPFPPLAPKQVLIDNKLGPGDTVGIVGLFRNHYGRVHNVPVMRTGHIASIHDEPIASKYCGYIDGYLIEANSIGGLSGSPVFIMRPEIMHIDRAADIQKMLVERFLLLGLIHGHFDVKNLNEDVVTDDAGSLGSGVNSGIGIVVPIEKILETIDHPHFVDARKEFIAMDREQTGATPDALLDEPVKQHLGPSGENPNHREDFTKLLGEAARKQPQGD